jgi:uncharacterized membrane protein (UPF0182 family)
MIWDRDPYITIAGGRLTWILDGYTTTGAIPYSSPTLYQQQELNYVRNSVKFTIDAYTGDWHAYVVEPNDPIIQCYDAIYPGLMEPASSAPQEIRAHYRYPEDLFTMQSHQLTRYHVTDILKFFRGEDAWQVPHVSGAQSGQEIDPYYVQMRLPDEPQDGFLLILPFSPVGSTNMIGWLAAHCDAPDYGRLTLYTFPSDRNINGPEQQEAQFETEPALSSKVSLLDQRGSRVAPGNLLVVPIGESVMYVKTLFLESDRAGIKGIPQLRIIVLAFSDRIVFADTYEEALRSLLNEGKTSSAGQAPSLPSQASPTPNLSDRTKEILLEALRLFDEADSALREGNWAKYGEIQSKIRKLLQDAQPGAK